MPKKKKKSKSKAYSGSLDPFEDIADKLDKLGVAYILSIGMEGYYNTRTWSNIRLYGQDGIGNFRSAANNHLDALQDELDNE